MKLAICTKFQINRMNCVESRRGAGPIDPPSRLRVTIFSRRLLGLKAIFRVTVPLFINQNKSRPKNDIVIAALHSDFEQ